MNTLQKTIDTSLNFAADRSNGGIWSNLTPEKITQKLQAHSVTIADARQLSTMPSLDGEGFTFQSDPLDTADWDDQAWIASSYVPQSLELVKALVDADLIIPYLHGAALIRDSGKNSTRAPAAEFVHLDQTRESAQAFLAFSTDEKTLKKYSRVQVYNVWRPLTPAPQDVPLAICDQRTLQEQDWVVGKTVEPNYPDGVPYLASVYNPGQRWFYVPDLSPDDVIVFKGFDSDTSAPMGCLHGAFKHPTNYENVIPRASIEVRFFALWV